MNHDWESVHYEALQIVDRDIGIKYFRRSGIPGSQTMFTLDEYLQFENQFYSMMNTFY